MYSHSFPNLYYHSGDRLFDNDCIIQVTSTRNSPITYVKEGDVILYLVTGNGLVREMTGKVTEETVSVVGEYFQMFKQ